MSRRPTLSPARRPRRGLALAALTAFVAPAVVAVGAVVTAAPAAADPVTTTGGSRQAEFHFTGTAQFFAVPEGVTALPFTVDGGAGGAGRGIVGAGPGGSGARVTGTLAVTPGQVLTVQVGESGRVGGEAARAGAPGAPAGGVGGGAGGGASANGGGGGSASVILAGATPLVVAGGGGGGGGAGAIAGYDGGRGGAGGASAGNGGNGLGLGAGLGGSGSRPVVDGDDGGGGYALGGGGGGGGGGYVDCSGCTGGGRGGQGGGGGGGGGGAGQAGGSYADPAVANLALAPAGNTAASSGAVVFTLGGAGTTVRFDRSDGLQTFTVPDGVTSLQITAAGGAGGSALSTPVYSGYTGGRGGAGGLLSGSVAVHAGQQLEVWTGRGGEVGGTRYLVLIGNGNLGHGGQGAPSGDDYRGGFGGNCRDAVPGCDLRGTAGGGGSPSYVTVDGVLTLLAGGGGGGASTGGEPYVPFAGPGGDGGNGGIQPGAGTSYGYRGRAAAAPGLPGGNGGATQGGWGQESNGDDKPHGGGPGGGGGGGYLGGGGGGAGQFDNNQIQDFTTTGGAGGAGGSSFAANDVTDLVDSAAGNAPGVDASGADGWVTISYRPASTTTVTSSVNPSSPGEPVTFTASVTGSDGTGTVDIVPSGYPAAGCSGLPIVAVDSGWQASCTVALNPGSTSVTARYSGDDGYSPSSGSLTQQVSVFDNSTRIALSPAQPQAGEPVTVTIFGFKSSHTGTSAFTVDGAVPPGCEAVATDGSDPPLDPNSPWLARCTFTAPGPGLHTVRGAYTGDRLFGDVAAAATFTAVGPLARLAVRDPEMTTSTSFPVAYAVQGYDAAGHALGDLTDRAAFGITPDGSCSGASCSAASPGPHTVTAVVDGVSGAFTVQVVDAYALQVRASSLVVPTGGTVVASATGTTYTGVDLGDVSSQVVFSGLVNGSCSGTVCTFRQAGGDALLAKIGTILGYVYVTVVDGAHLVVTPSSATPVAGSPVTMTARLVSSTGDDLGDVTDRTAFSLGGTPCAGARCTVTQTGAQTVSAADGSATGSAALTVTPGAPAALTLGTSAPAVRVGAPVTLTATGTDLGGNALGDVTGSTTFTITPDGSCSGAVCTPASAGAHTVTAANGSATAAVPLAVRLYGQQVALKAPDRASYGASVAIRATGGASGQPVVVAAAGDPGVCRLDGSTLSFTGVGTCVVTATQTGTDRYAPGRTVRSITVRPAVLHVDARPARKVAGAPDPAPVGVVRASDLRFGETAATAGLTGAMSCVLAAHGEDVGKYAGAVTCTPGSLTAPHYTVIAGQPAALVITAPRNRPSSW